MTNVSNSLPIESLVTLTLGRIADDSTLDLRQMVDQVDANIELKERLRNMQAKVELYKEAVRNGDGMKVTQLMDDIRGVMGPSVEEGGLGLGPNNSEEGEMVRNLPGWARYADGEAAVKVDGQWKRLSQLDQEARDELLSGPIKSFETMLDHRAQSLSDLGQKLQFMLQEKNNVYTRANKAQSDILNKYDGSLNAIANNLRG